MTRLATRSKNKALQRIADILEEEETSTRVTRSSSGDSVLTRTPIVYIDVENPLEIASGRVIAFDVETSGFSNSDCIIEIGAVELIDGVRTGILCWLTFQIIHLADKYNLLRRVVSIVYLPEG